MKKKVKKTVKSRPTITWVKDKMAPHNPEFSVERSYGGVLFSSHFCLTYSDAKKVVKIINNILELEKQK